MQSYEEFFKLPEWEEILRKIRHEVGQTQRPPDQVIMDDVDLCKFLKMCKRKIATLRASNEIAYSKCGGKILYFLSDVLDYVSANKVELSSKMVKSRIK